MKLYHGTTENVALQSLHTGLCPRNESRVRSVWEDTVPSADDRVYLTVAYAPYFASAAVEEAGGDQRWGIVEIDSAKLDQSRIVPDEDFLEQGTRAAKTEDLWSWPAAWIAATIDRSMEERTAFYRDNVREFAHLWQRSIEMMGNCAYLGSVPADAITRISLFDPETNLWLAVAALDPTISILNYRICERKYRSLSRWFFDPTSADAIAIMNRSITHFDETLKEGGEAADIYRRQLVSTQKMLRETSGLQIIERASVVG